MIPPGDARADEWIGQELSKTEYWRLWWPLLKRRIADFFGGDAIGGGATSALAVLLVLILLAVVVGSLAYVTRLRMRRRPVAPASPAGVFDDDRLNAQDYRRRAAEHAAAGRHTDALLDAYRALSAHAVERGFAPDAPDLTAADAARALLAVHAPETTEIIAAQHLFDEVRYGGAAASPQQAARVGALDARLLVATPTAPVPGAVPALPSLPR